MDRLSLCPTSLAQWHTLVQDAERAAGKKLTEELESYLVLLLQRFTDKPEIALSVLGLDYLEGQIAKGAQQQLQLREVGDKCLLFSGLFPERAIRRNVSVSYFVALGQQAYHLLATLSETQKTHMATAGLFNALDLQFVTLMDTLHCMRELAGEAFSISPLQAEELWRTAHSQHAFEVLQRYTQATPLIVATTLKNLH